MKKLLFCSCIAISMVACKKESGTNGCEWFGSKIEHKYLVTLYGNSIPPYPTTNGGGYFSNDSTFIIGGEAQFHIKSCGQKEVSLQYYNLLNGTIIPGMLPSTCCTPVTVYSDPVYLITLQNNGGELYNINITQNGHRNLFIQFVPSKGITEFDQYGFGQYYSLSRTYTLIQ